MVQEIWSGQPRQCRPRLEKKNGQKRFIHNLHSETGVLLSDPFEIRNRAVGFYRKLYESELFLDESDVRTNTLILIH